jgi:hypothetical protein
MENMENTCSICNEKYEGFGNNARPINDGECCDACNQEVIYQRLQMIVEGVDFDEVSKLRTKETFDPPKPTLVSAKLTFNSHAPNTIKTKYKND